MYIKLYRKAFEDGLSPSETILYGYLVNTQVYPVDFGNYRLSEYTGLSMKTISRTVKSLADRGLIEVHYWTSTTIKDPSNIGGGCYYNRRRTITYVKEDYAEGDYYIYNPLWRTDIGLTIAESCILAVFTSLQNYQDKTDALSGFTISDIAETLNLSYRTVTKSLRMLEDLSIISRSKEEGSNKNEYTVDPFFSKASDREDLIELFLCDDNFMEVGFEFIRSEYSYPLKNPRLTLFCRKAFNKLMQAYSLHDWYLNNEIEGYQPRFWQKVFDKLTDIFFDIGDTVYE